MEVTTSKYGVFWTPSKSVTNIIQSWKDRMRSLESDAIYLNHPVHCTFFLVAAHVEDEKNIMASFEECCHSISKLIIEFSHWHIFKSDTATGGDTVVLAMKPTDVLLQTQEKIAAALIVFKKEPIYYPVSWFGAYRKSFDKWGFPFVGNHWLPHITIASVNNKGKKIMGEISRQNIPQGEFLNSLSLFRINGQVHEHLKTIDLT